MKDPERDEKVCDFCGSVGILWAWETPNVVDSAAEAKEKNVFWVEDPWWYSCDTCHRMILAGKGQSILDRALAYHSKGILVGFDNDGVAHKIDPVEHVKVVHEVFWGNKNGVYEEVTK